MKCIAALILLTSLRAFAQDIPGSTILSVGYMYPQPYMVAPGQVLTIYLPGPIPNDFSVTVHQVNDHPAPVLDIRPPIVCSNIVAPCPSIAAVDIQIPFEISPYCFYCAVVQGFSTSLFLTVDGVPGPEFTLMPLPDQVHILTACDTVVGGNGLTPVNGLPCAPYVTHADGSLVSAASPAHADEVLVAYAVGLGLTQPVVPTGQPAPNGAVTQQTFLLDFNYHPNALPAKPVAPLPPALTRYGVPLFSGLTPGYVGLYQVNFLVPPAPAGLIGCGGTVQSNLTMSVGGAYSFGGAGICLTP